MTLLLKFFLLTNFLAFILAGSDWSEDQYPDKWNKYSKDKISQMLKRKINGNVAKNILFYLGDGMGIPTVTSGRIRKGQINNRNGEEEITNMENLDHVALSKTYNIDAQTADSAGTATAFLTGVKSRIRAIGVDGRAIDCPTTLTSKLDSILKWAHNAGKSVGIVTTTRVTHATPSASYANIFFREMEAYDGINFLDKHRDQGCKDIAAQLIDDNNFINLVFGGGRRKFTRVEDKDVLNNKPGDRIDNRNLIDDWKQKMQQQNLKHKYLWNKTEFNELKPNQYDRILGLFNWDHMEYESDRNPNIEPSLIEMTEKAIKILSTNPKGYFLLVEGGKIDLAHHGNNAKRALDDFVIFDEAIGKGKELVSLEETILVVTADHSHVFSLGGYAVRGNPLFGIVITTEKDKISKLNTTFTSLLYANGPSAMTHMRKVNLTNEVTENVNYTQEVAIPLSLETHGGEDVSIYASGPMAYLFDGTVEQSHIAHVMAYSACIGPYNNSECRFNRGVLIPKNSGFIFKPSSYLFHQIFFIFSIIYFLVY